MNRSRHVSRLAGLLLLVAPTGLPEPGFVVLCIGGAGHVVIETGSERCELPAFDHGIPDTPDPGSTHPEPETCCGPCADLPLDAPVLAGVSGPRHRSTEMHDVPGPTTTVLPLATSIRGTAPAPRTGQRISVPTPAGLATIILRV